MAALAQTISAIAIVGILAVALKATSIQIRVTESWLETASWGLIALLRVWLPYSQVRPLVKRTSRGRHGYTHEHHDGSHASFACAPARLASIAVGSRALAAKLAGGGSVWAGRVQSAAGILGSALVFSLGASFFLASLSTGPL